MGTSADWVQIRQLQAAYGDAVTRQAWDELESMFLPDCPIRIDVRSGSVIEKIGPQALGAFIAASIERFEFFLFTIQNAVVHVEHDARASGRVYIRELRQERDGHRWTTAYGLYRDTYRKVDGTWSFASRDYTTLARSEGDGMAVFDIP